MRRGERPHCDEGGGDNIVRSGENGVGLIEALSIVGSGVGELFPPNKITAHCKGCGCIIPRLEGYRHINIGAKKTYCSACHSGAGLPLRVVYE